MNNERKEKYALNAEMNTLRNNTMYKGCVHKDLNCSEIISAAHSIQKNRYLDNISVNDKVMCVVFGKFGLTSRTELYEEKLKWASTFTGFCSHHDNIIFKPIEKHDYYLNNIEQNFLFAYRAFAMSYFERQSTYMFKKGHLEFDRKNGRVNKDLEISIANYKKYIVFMEKLRISMNNNLDNKQFNKIRTDVLIWPKNFGIAATSMYFIHKDKKGNVINNPYGNFAPFFFTIIPQLDNTFVLFSYLSKDKTRYEFIKEQIVNAPQSEQLMLVTNILALSIENFFISPKKWESIPAETRNMFLDAFDSTYNIEPPPMGIYKNLNIFV